MEPHERELQTYTVTDSVTSGPLYQERLLGDEIRLITLLPSVDPSQPICCELNRYDLGESPEYESLSYVWGNPNAQAEVFCNNQSIMVTINLENALKRLRHPDTPRTIWADAICMNQHDTAEKNHQIPLMRTIYSSAKRVVVWLGHGIPDLIDPVKTAFGKYDEYIDGNGAASNVPWDALQVLFASTWFERIWCIQEVQLAREILVCFGDEEIAWDDIASIVDQLSDRHLVGKLGGPQIDPLEFGVSWEYAYLMCMAPKDRSLIDTIQHYNHSKASDERDKVYGVLGIVNPKAEAEAVTVDYTKSIEQVCEDAIRASIQHSSSLIALDYIAHREAYKGEENIKSWALQIDKNCNTYPLLYGTGTVEWYPSGRTQIQLIQGDHSNSPDLSIRGLLVDDIQLVSDINPDNRGENAHFDWRAENVAQVAMELWNKVLGSLDPTSPDAIGAIGAMARTFTGALCHHDGRTYDVLAPEKEEERRQHSSDFLLYIDKIIRDHQLQNRTSIDPLQYLEDHNQFFNPRGNVIVYERLAIRCTSEQRRRTFYTSNGALGIGPRCMRAGDIVAVLYGASNAPYALRPRNNGKEFLFLGQVYIDEFCAGHRLEDMRAGKFEERDFLLV